MKSFKNYIAEAKSVGILYHYTSLKNMLDIIRSDELVQSRPRKGETVGAISFTRNKHFSRISRPIATPFQCRFVIDGTKLSTNYKVEPYNWFHNLSGNTRHVESVDEQEERVLGNNITDFSKYIIRVEIFIKELKQAMDVDFIPNYFPKIKRDNVNFKSFVKTEQEFMSYLESVLPYEVRGI